MKIYRDGKEVKDAEIIFDVKGRPAFVRQDGVNYDTGAFEFEDTEGVEKTKTAVENQEVNKPRKQQSKIKK